MLELDLELVDFLIILLLLEELTDDRDELEELFELCEDGKIAVLDDDTLEILEVEDELDKDELDEEREELLPEESDELE